VTTTVCIIDGDPAVRDSLATVVGLNGHQALTFASGNEFLDQTRASKPQCVVCEAELPDTTGMALFEALKAQNPKMRFALLVSHTDAAIAARAKRLGIDHVFFKPLVNRRLLAFVSASDASQQ
jgi:FixJ family two-component response regulator